MSHKDGTMVYRLGKPLKYSKDGQFVDAEFIELYEFGAAHTRQYMKLKQFVDKAIFDAQKLADGRSEVDTSVSKAKSLHEVGEEEHEDSTEGLAELLNVSMSISDDEDRLFKFTAAFKELVLRTDQHPIGKIDGIKILNDNLWNDIHPEEQLAIATRYCAFFGIGLLGQMKEESETASERPTEVKEL